MMPMQSRHFYASRHAGKIQNTKTSFFDDVARRDLSLFDAMKGHFWFYSLYAFHYFDRR